MVRLLVAALVQDAETRTLAAGAANDVADAPTTKRTLLRRIAATCARWMGSGQREVIVLPLTTIYTIRHRWWSLLRHPNCRLRAS